MAEIDMIAHLAETLFQNLLPEDLTPAQFGVLNRLARLNKQETITELAQAFMVKQPTMSSTAKKLLDKEFVTFEQDPDDKRVRYVAITKKGERERKRIIKSLQPLYDQYGSLKGKADWAPMLEFLYELRTHLEKSVYD